MTLVNSAESASPKLWEEKWFKIATAIVAVLYVCGYGGITAFTRNLGLSAGHFGYGEADYVIQVFFFLLPDAALLHRGLGAYVRTGPLWLWLPFAALFALAFAQPSHKERVTTLLGRLLGWLRGKNDADSRETAARSLGLLILTIVVYVSANHYGTQRALRVRAGEYRLPLVNLAYHADGLTNNPCYPTLRDPQTC